MGGATGGGTGLGGFGFTFGQGFSLNVTGLGGFASQSSGQGMNALVLQSFLLIKLMFT